MVAFQPGRILAQADPGCMLIDIVSAAAGQQVAEQVGKGRRVALAQEGILGLGPFFFRTSEEPQ